MSLPMHLNVVVVGEDGEIAGIVAAVLRGKDVGGYNPRILAASAVVSSKKSMLFLSGK